MEYLHLPNTDIDALSNDSQDTQDTETFKTDEPYPLQLPSPVGCFVACDATTLGSTAKLLSSGTPSPVADSVILSEQGQLAHFLVQPSDCNLEDNDGQKAEHAAMDIPSEGSSDAATTEAATHLLEPAYQQFTLKTQNTEKTQFDAMQARLKQINGEPAFVHWNWPIIRQVCFGTSVAGILALFCVCLAMLISLPRKCEPYHTWYQGAVMYEVFPASFKDSNGDGIGDLHGLETHLGYLSTMGITVLRLNSIFPCRSYPDHYLDVRSMTEVEPSLGSVDDVKVLLETAHRKNISVVMDIFVEPLLNLSMEAVHSMRHERYLDSYLPNVSFITPKKTPSFPRLGDDMASVLDFWVRKGVDGFYIKDLELVAREPDIGEIFSQWRSVLDSYSQYENEKMLMVSSGFLFILNSVSSHQFERVLQKIDVVDVFVAVGPNLTSSLTGQVESLLSADWFTAPSSPWINWNLGSPSTPRLASRLASPNATLGAQLFLLSLPGSATIFYGDEIGTVQSDDPEGELEVPIHQLAPLAWDESECAGFTLSTSLPWLWLSPGYQQRNIKALQSVLDLLAEASRQKTNAASLYMNGIFESTCDGNNSGCKKPSHNLRYVDDNVVVLERFYYRKSHYALVANFDAQVQQRDLSGILNHGLVVAGSHRNEGERVSFQNVVLSSGEAILVQLDK